MAVLFKNRHYVNTMIINNKEIKRQVCMVYARCCGWLAPTNNFNKGLKAQYKDRKTYKIK